MGKKSTDQASAKTTNQSQTEVHVETHTTAEASAGSASPRDSNDQPLDPTATSPTDQPAASTASSGDRVEELTADLKRLQAEFANYRRRAEAERAEVLDFAKIRVVREFLAVRDNFDRELAGRPADVPAAWATSIDAIRTQFDQVLKTLGVERFDSKGQPFDPHLHEAIAVEDGEGTQEIVAEELQPGYKLGSTILRHAIVKVGKATPPSDVN